MLQHMPENLCCRASKDENPNYCRFARELGKPARCIDFGTWDIVFNSESGKLLFVMLTMHGAELLMLPCSLLGRAAIFSMRGTSATKPFRIAKLVEDPGAVDSGAAFSPDFAYDSSFTFAQAVSISAKVHSCQRSFVPSLLASVARSSTRPKTC